MKLTLRSFTIVVILLGSLYFTVFGQSDAYRLNLRRDFGYSSGRQIKGAFTISITGATDKIQSVRYLLDGKIMADVSQAPFSLSFDTGNYAYGVHELGAAIQLSDGSQVTVTPLPVEFATPEQESSAVTGIVFPILGLLVLITLVGMGIQFLVLRKRPLTELPPGTERKYGLSGGTVCPRCHRPFAFHWWAFKLVTHKYDRCDYCGKVGVMRIMSISALRAAEKAEISLLSAQPLVTQKTDDDKLKDMLDQSRYTDHS